MQQMKYQVRDLFDRFPDTIHSDIILLMKYLEEQHNIHSHQSLRFIVGYFKTLNKSLSSVDASLRRSSRFWRMKYPDTYKRDKERMLELELAYRDTFRRG